MYQYDFSGKLLRAHVYDSETSQPTTGSQYTYNAKSQLTAADYYIGYSLANGVETETLSYVFTYDNAEVPPSTPPSVSWPAV